MHAFDYGSRSPEELQRYRYHFSGISGNLEMSGNFAKIREKSGKVLVECVLSGIIFIVTSWQYAGNKTFVSCSHNRCSLERLVLFRVAAKGCVQIKSMPVYDIYHFYVNTCSLNAHLLFNISS